MASFPLMKPHLAAALARFAAVLTAQQAPRHLTDGLSSTAPPAIDDAVRLVRRWLTEEQLCMVVRGESEEAVRFETLLVASRWLIFAIETAAPASTRYVAEAMAALDAYPAPTSASHPHLPIKADMLIRQLAIEVCDEDEDVAALRRQLTTIARRAMVKHTAY